MWMTGHADALNRRGTAQEGLAPCSRVKRPRFFGPQYGKQWSPAKLQRPVRAKSIWFNIVPNMDAACAGRLDMGRPVRGRRRRQG